MSGFLEGSYGVEDARREKRIRRIIAVVAASLSIAGALYFGLRNYREKRQVALFVELLRSRDYQGAYRLWGCTEESPCRDYTFDKFLEDWGPESPNAAIDWARVERTQPCSATYLSVWMFRLLRKLGTPSTCSCETGIIQTLVFPDGGQVDLWVERRDRTIGFAPWPVCSPRMQVP